MLILLRGLWPRPILVPSVSSQRPDVDSGHRDSPCYLVGRSRGRVEGTALAIFRRECQDRLINIVAMLGLGCVPEAEPGSFSSRSPIRLTLHQKMHRGKHLHGQGPVVKPNDLRESALPQSGLMSDAGCEVSHLGAIHLRMEGPMYRFPPFFDPLIR